MLWKLFISLHIKYLYFKQQLKFPWLGQIILSHGSWWVSSEKQLENREGCYLELVETIDKIMIGLWKELTVTGNFVIDNSKKQKGLNWKVKFYMNRKIASIKITSRDFVYCVKKCILVFLTSSQARSSAITNRNTICLLL